MKPFTGEGTVSQYLLGQGFVHKFTRLFRATGEGFTLQCIVLKAVFVT